MTLLGLRNPLRVEQPKVKQEKNEKVFLTPGELRKLKGKKRKSEKASAAPTPKRGVAKPTQEKQPNLKVVATLKLNEEGETVKVDLPEKKSSSFLTQFKKEQKAGWDTIVSQRIRMKRQTVFSNIVFKCLQQLNGFSNLVAEGGV